MNHYDIYLKHRDRHTPDLLLYTGMQVVGKYLKRYVMSIPCIVGDVIGTLRPPTWQIAVKHTYHFRVIKSFSNKRV